MTRLIYWAAGLSMAAALIHALVVPEHLVEWWGYGLFFILAALAQAGYAIVLVIQPWRYDSTGGIRDDGGIGPARTYYAVGIAGNLALIVMYGITRTVGIPFFGPEAGTVEELTALSLVAKATEVLLVGCLVRLYMTSRGPVPQG